MKYKYLIPRGTLVEITDSLMQPNQKQQVVTNFSVVFTSDELFASHWAIGDIPSLVFKLTTDHLPFMFIHVLEEEIRIEKI